MKDSSFSVWSAAMDLIALGVLTLLLCLPVVTACPAVTALYYAVAKSVRRGRGGPYREYFRSFRENFLQGAGLSVILALFCAVGFFAAVYVVNEPLSAAVDLFYRATFVFALIAAFIILCLACPVLSRFRFKTAQILLFSLRVALKFPLRALGLAALWAALLAVYAVVASLLIAGAACALGGVALLFLQGFAQGLCSGFSIVTAQRFGAEARFASVERSKWLSMLAKSDPAQFTLHQDGLFFALRALGALAREKRTLSAWRADMPRVHRTSRVVEVSPAERGRALRAFSEAEQDAQVGGGIRLNRDRGWAWICPDEQRPLCRIVSESADAEFADELCAFCESALKEHIGRS